MRAKSSTVESSPQGGGDFFNPLARGSLASPGSASNGEGSTSPPMSPRELSEADEEAEAVVRQAKVEARQLTLHDLYQDPNFILRAALYAGGICVLHLGLFLRYSDLVYLLTAPGWCLLGAYFVLDCRANKQNVAGGGKDRWTAGKSGGSFFLGISSMVAVFSSLQVSNWCPVHGNELVADAGVMVDKGGRPSLRVFTSPLQLAQRYGSRTASGLCSWGRGITTCNLTRN
jgi:hypothetical protein